MPDRRRYHCRLRVGLTPPGQPWPRPLPERPWRVVRVRRRRRRGLRGGSSWALSKTCWPPRAWEGARGFSSPPRLLGCDPEKSTCLEPDIGLAGGCKVREGFAFADAPRIGGPAPRPGTRLTGRQRTPKRANRLTDQRLQDATRRESGGRRRSTSSGHPRVRFGCRLELKAPSSDLRRAIGLPVRRIRATCEAVHTLSRHPFDILLQWMYSGEKSDEGLRIGLRWGDCRGSGICPGLGTRGRSASWPPRLP